MSNTDRDDQICRLYAAGATLEYLGSVYTLSRQRIQQIVMKAGIFRGTVQRSDREEFLGVNVTRDDKKALLREAHRRGLSMSALTSDMIKEMLKR